MRSHGVSDVSLSPPAKRRKISTVDAGLFETQSICQYAFSDTHHLEEANDLCSTYDRLLPFIPNCRDFASTKLPACQSGWAFQEGVEEIHNVVRDTYQRLERGVQLLRCQMARFSEATLSLARWYERGDLFCELSPNTLWWWYNAC